MAHPPTAIVVSPGCPRGAPLADVRFLLGRALEIARPEYVLAAALPRDEFTRLFGAILRAFHPRHARRAGGRRRRGGDVAQAAALQGGASGSRELFRELGDTAVLVGELAARGAAHGQPRRACWRRATSIAAARVLIAEGDRDGVRELARFAASRRLRCAARRSS